MIVPNAFNQDKHISILLPEQPGFVLQHVRSQNAADLQQHCWPTYKLSVITELLNRIERMHNREHGLGLIVFHHPSKSVVGYGQVVRWGQKGEISDLVIAEPYRGQGIGTQLILQLLHYAEGIELSYAEINVVASNEAAHRLYNRLGFEDAYSMLLNLGHGPEKIIHMRQKLASHAP